jgi:hypothetical protein
MDGKRRIDGEVIGDKYRGRGIGLVQTGWGIGWGLSALA